MGIWIFSAKTRSCHPSWLRDSKDGGWVKLRCKKSKLAALVSHGLSMAIQPAWPPVLGRPWCLGRVGLTDGAWSLPAAWAGGPTLWPVYPNPQIHSLSVPPGWTGTISVPATPPAPLLQKRLAPLLTAHGTLQMSIRLPASVGSYMEDSVECHDSNLWWILTA